ncbi:cytochrome c oxidase subunit II [Oceanibium sediminis]|uniref:cytochrome c oxidase subunit II n=1 Tax=Oceanibium sediminis TaxID=2026339 RepID=UPI00280BF1AB|nr:cytochrome c oxidase subunit II [Oceanibium sediminis]
MAKAQDSFEGLEIIGTPTPGATGFQPAATELARDIHWLDNFLLVIITAIVLFVVALLAIVILKYNRKSNPEPARFTHNSAIEVTWTVVPILILLAIGSFSLPILFKQLEVPEADVTIKTTGFQWAWSYEYPDNDVSFDSFMLGLGAAEMNDEVRAELAEYGYSEEQWKLATDTAVVVPVGRVVRLQVTASDVIHSWKIPAFGVHIDAVPGRLNETWFQVDEPGVYFGQCSELCGINHAYMPITVKAVSDEQYAAWIESQGGQMVGFLEDFATVDVAQAD